MENVQSQGYAAQDLGMDINTPLEIKRENLRMIAMIKSDTEFAAVLRPVFNLLSFGMFDSCPLSSDIRLRMISESIIADHVKEVAKHRRNREKQVIRINKRWDEWKKSNKKYTVVLPQEYRGITAVIPTPNPTPNPNPTPKNKSNITTESESESDIKPDKGGSETESESVVVSADEIAKSIASTKTPRINPWRMSEDEIRYGTISTVVLLKSAFGSGSWRTAVNQAGEQNVRELFLIFRSEIKAGEMPKNLAAAFTARLKNDLEVDFNAGKGAA